MIACSFAVRIAYLVIDRNDATYATHEGGEKEEQAKKSDGFVFVYVYTRTIYQSTLKKKHAVNFRRTDCYHGKWHDRERDTPFKRHRLSWFPSSELAPESTELEK